MRGTITKTTIPEPSPLEGTELMFHFQGNSELNIPLDFAPPLKAILCVAGKETPIIIEESFELAELFHKNGGSNSFSLKFNSPCGMERNFKLPEGMSAWVTPLENNPYNTPIATLSN